jgi:hypothetical protein
MEIIYTRFRAIYLEAPHETNDDHCTLTSPTKIKVLWVLDTHSAFSGHSKTYLTSEPNCGKVKLKSLGKIKCKSIAKR